MSSLDSMVVEYVSKLKELCLPVVQLPEKDKDFINVPSKEKVQAHTRWFLDLRALPNYLLRSFVLGSHPYCNIFPDFKFIVYLKI